MAFNKRYDDFVAKRTKAVAKRRKALSIAVLKAFVKKQKESRHENTMVEFSRTKLDFLQMRRQFKCLKMFAVWQRNWIKVVRANAKLRLTKACFKQLYVSALGKRTKRAVRLRILSSCFQKVKGYYMLTRRMSEQVRLKYKRMVLVGRCFRRLNEYRKFEQASRAALAKSVKIRNKFVQIMAFKSLKLFRQKALELERDPISLRLLLADNVVLGENGEFVVL